VNERKHDPQTVQSTIEESNKGSRTRKYSASGPPLPLTVEKIESDRADTPFDPTNDLKETSSTVLKGGPDAGTESVHAFVEGRVVEQPPADTVDDSSASEDGEEDGDVCADTETSEVAEARPKRAAMVGPATGGPRDTPRAPVWAGRGGRHGHYWSGEQFGGSSGSRWRVRSRRFRRCDGRVRVGSGTF
jgi:hypothetical protein